MQNVYSFLADSAKSYPNKVCIADKDREWTFSEVHRMAIRLAGDLRCYNVATGDRVLIFLENSIEYVVALFSIFYTGAIAVPVNKDVTIDNLCHIINETKPKTAISNEMLSTKLENSDHAHDYMLLKVECTLLLLAEEAALPTALPTALPAALPTALPTALQAALPTAIPKALPTTLPAALQAALPAALPAAVGVLVVQEATAACEEALPVNECVTAMLIYTSGTTRLPKGVTLTHKNLFANTESILQYLKLTSDDSVLATISFTYSYGNSILLTHIKSGGTIIIENRSAFPVIILEQLKNTRVTGFSTLGSYLNRLLKLDTMKPGLNGTTGPFGLPDLCDTSDSGGTTGPFGLPDIRDTSDSDVTTGSFGLSDLRDTSDSGGTTGPFGLPDLCETSDSGGPFKHLRYVTLAGERTSHEDIMKLNALAPHVKIFNMYGQTEAAARLSYLEPEMLFKKTGSIGRGIPGVKLRVVAEDGRDVVPGETGEIIAYGDNIMKGYWNNEDGTREVIRDGWLYTGDIAEIDTDGYIYIKGRRDDIIKHLGYRISPCEIEAVINSCDNVIESAVVGIYDGNSMKIKAFVVTGGRSPVADLILTNIRKTLPPFKRPHIIEFVRELPKTANGKIMRSALRDIKSSINTK